MTPTRLYVGIDLGTSSLKALAVDASGTTRGHSRQPYATHRPEIGAAEQDPADWIRAIHDAITDLRDQTDASTWRAAALTGMMPTLVTLDDELRPVGSAVTWQDDRAGRYGDDLRDRAGGDALYRRTGQWVDGRYLLPMAAAARRRNGDAGRIIAGAKDYLFAALTGELATDPSTAAGYGCYDLDTGWIDAMTDRGVLPPVMPSDHWRAATPEAVTALGIPAGLPIVLGGADSVLGADAVGATEPRDAAYLTGSSTIMLRRVEAAVVDSRHRYLLTPTAEGSLAAEMDLLATGSGIGWMTTLLAAPSGQVAGAAAIDPFEPGLPLMLGYLAPGEQGALWDDGLTGTVTGLTLAHSGAHLVRALTTAIVVESARCMGVFESAFGGIGTIRAGGPGLARPMAQDLADACGTRVAVFRDCPSYAAYGAAQLAARSVDSVEIPCVAVDFTVEPAASRRAAWAALTRKHDDLRERLRGFDADGGDNDESDDNGSATGSSGTDGTDNNGSADGSDDGIGNSNDAAAGAR